MEARPLDGNSAAGLSGGSAGWFSKRPATWETSTRELRRAAGYDEPAIKMNRQAKPNNDNNGSTAVVSRPTQQGS